MSGIFILIEKVDMGGQLGNSHKFGNEFDWSNFFIEGGLMTPGISGTGYWVFEENIRDWF